VRATATFFVFVYALLLLLALENCHLAHSPLPRPRWPMFVTERAERWLSPLKSV